MHLVFVPLLLLPYRPPSLSTRRRRFCRFLTSPPALQAQGLLRILLWFGHPRRVPVPRIRRPLAASDACALSRHSEHDVVVDGRNRVHVTPTSTCHAVCAPSFSSRTSLQFRRFTAVGKPKWQAWTQSCGRYHAVTPSASAVTLRGIPRRRGENVEITARPQSASEGGTAQISTVTPLCTASGPRRSDSIAKRESAVTGTRVGGRDAAARRGTRKHLWPCSVARHSARQGHARLPAAVR
ncbi:hypothetical protein MOQ_006635 [Trypanosoma cruzi marinkellei]|uniref:Uncharacterized protein n=1 Tax=Trypanosoma cruzi marinkellei TaxID=85056 RepID=K2N4J8_TRYCR|nr:hypothetical protein MOQ_006635 [Trypanosoma cruzi marinkellei]